MIKSKHRFLFLNVLNLDNIDECLVYSTMSATNDKVVQEHSIQCPEISIELKDFTIKFVEEQNYHAKAGELHSFVLSFSQSSKVEDVDLGKIFFLSLIAKVPELFTALTNFSVENKNDKELKTLNLQVVVEEEAMSYAASFEGAMLCLDTLDMCFKCTRTNEQLQSLFRTTINILCQAYTHCKESELLYGDLLEDFTDQLASFFTKIQALQTAMFLEFDRIIILDLNHADVSALVHICGDLGKLCELVFSLDTALAAKLWRIFIKIITKYSELAREKLKVESILSTLISNIIDIVNDYKFRLENAEQIQESEIKIFLFQLNLVMKIFHIFHGCMDGTLQNIRTLSLSLYDLLMLSYSAIVTDENNIILLKSAVRNTVKPMIPLFYSDSSFLTIALQQSTGDPPCDLHLADVLLKLSGLDYLLSNKNHMSIQKNEEIFRNVIFTLQSNKPNDDMMLASIKLPLSLFRNLDSLGEESEESASIYQHAYNHLSEYSKIISDFDFEKLEDSLLELLVSSSDLVSLLVGDVWIYRLRCSSTEYLYERCVSVLQKLSQVKSSTRLQQIMKRMLKFLPPDCMMKIFQNHEHLKHVIHNPDKVLHRYGAPELSDSISRKENSDTSHKLALLMDKLKSPISNNTPELTARACCILELFSLFVDVSQSSEILKYIELAGYLFHSEIYDIQIAALTFLKAFKRKHLPETDPDFRKIINTFAKLLAKTLQSRNYVVRCEAFNTYVCLAKSPSLLKVCQQTVVIAPNLAADIKSYFTKIPSSRFLTDKERTENLQKQIHSLPNIQSQSETVLEESRNILLPLLPVLK